MNNKELIYKIVFCIGAVISVLYVFADMGYGITLWKCMTDEYFMSGVGMLLSFADYQFWAENPNMISVLIFWLPLVLYSVTAVMLFLSKKKVYALISGIIAIVVFVVLDIIMLSEDLIYSGLYINIIGTIIAFIGLLLAVVGSESDNKDDKTVGVVKCIAGEFAGGAFEVEDALVIGNDPNACNLILSNKTVSHVHCIIKYIPGTDTYTVKDMSTNGTYLKDGQRLVKDFEMQLQKNTELYFGEPKEIFVLS